MKTFFQGFGRWFHGLNSEGNEGEPVAGNRVPDFIHDFGDGHELIGALGELLSALDNGSGVDNGDADAFAGFATADREIRGNQRLHVVLGLW